MIVDERFWQDVSDLHAPFLLASLARPLLERKNGVRDSARTAESLLFVTGATQLLKSIARERRPDGSGLDSFPSGHASTAFAVATMSASLYPREAPIWYGGATLIAISRSEIGVHFFHDVVAGSALGYGISRFLIGRPRGLAIAPLFSGESRGVQFSVRF